MCDNCPNKAEWNQSDIYTQVTITYPDTSQLTFAAKHLDNDQIERIHAIVYEKESQPAKPTN